MSRSTGILLPIFSLPSAYGIGGFGKEAYKFIDYLKANDRLYWQILPLNYPGYGDSPYNPISCLAGNPYFIDPEMLFESGLLTKCDLDSARLPDTGKVHYHLVYKTKQKCFRKAFTDFCQKRGESSLLEFLEREKEWLKPFSLFSYAKSAHSSLPWQKWQQEFRFYSNQVFEKIYRQKPEELLYPVFLQYIFQEQLSALKRYAVSQNIKIIGDLPLYAALESCDVWSQQELFDLDKNGYPNKVAGVPPDAFSETGQLWGNPLYNWSKMQEDNFTWWKTRLTKAFEFADYLRLDHFIGFVNFWAVDAKAKTAQVGKWLPGPSYAFFDAILNDFPAQNFIAEDLGILTDAVNAVRDHYGFPGMIILQFCFQDEKNDVLSFPENKIIYTGTHDNQTTTGWFLTNQAEGKPDNHFLEEYLHKTGFLFDGERLTPQNVATCLIKLAEASPCRIAIFPLQDILGLDDSTRINIPGTALGNWRWRLKSFDLS
ncbi:MAG TPA: 4-alpha-glucanotransferase [Candidatus Cloacimonadota bacterium]|nr:4-alpha-glucanotransferase [Candidatus Cloacimonadota bacterium]